MRTKFWMYLFSNEGKKLKDTRVNFYLSNSTHPAQIYVHPYTGPSMTTEQANIKTDKNGYFQFFIGDMNELSGG